MLTIWGRLNSHNVKKVVWLADELGLDFVRHDVGGAFGMDDAYRCLNPNALIPTIQDNDTVLWESNAILRYLAGQYGGERWWPSNAATRATMDKWMDWQFALADAQRGLFVNLVRTPVDRRDMAAVSKSASIAARLMKIADEALASQPWLSGQEIGIGDIPVGVYAHTYFALEFDRPDLPNLWAWYQRLTARDAYARTVMIPLT